MPTARKSLLFSPYARTRIARTFPPITNHLSLSPEHSPSPLILMINRTFAISFEDPPLLRTTDTSDIPPRPTSLSVAVELSCSPGTTGNRFGTMGDNGKDIMLHEILDLRPPLIDSSTSIANPIYEDVPDNRKIPKPKGEVGHPGGNGYSLPSKLQWEKTVYDTVQKGVHKLADGYLNTSVGISQQHEDDVQQVLEKARHQFPILCRYAGYWLARDMVKLYLKNSSGRACRDQKITLCMTRQRGTPGPSA
ncbi:hypothetical protein M422DRAFT_243817 [Sphaerobolus stellatus SS14]|nr:hypothetical protein M422DRAFT_243817 [Sphaerobolus stellatus SS14]